MRSGRQAEARRSRLFEPLDDGSHLDLERRQLLRDYLPDELVLDVEVPVGKPIALDDCRADG